MTTFRLLRRTTVLASVLFASSATAETLTVVSWGGSYEQASRKAILEPFSKETGIEIRVEVYNGGLAQVRAQVETGKVYWDVIDLEMADAARGCDEGLLEYVDVSNLAPAPDGTPAAEDCCSTPRSTLTTPTASPTRSPPPSTTFSIWTVFPVAAACGGHRR